MDDIRYIDRHAEKAIKSLSKMFKAVLLTGPRQAGKSTCITHVNKKIDYITFDDMVTKKRWSDDPMGFFESYEIPLIMDEIQKVPEAFLQIKNIIDKSNKKPQFFLSGSQSFLLMKNVTESLTGRVGIINMLPLSIREKYNIKIYDNFLPTKKYISKRKKLGADIKIDIWDNILKGGMPALYNGEKVDRKKYFSSYVTAYLEKDVRELSQVGNLTKFYDFMVALSSTASSLLNIEALSDNLNINRKTCEHYLSILEASHIIYILKPYHNNLMKRLIKTPKVYFLDTGLLSYLLGWHDKKTLEVGPLSGMFFEDFVVSEIIKSYYNNGELHLPFYYYRDKDKKEIDLLIEENGTLYPIEIKKHTTIDTNDAKNFSVLNNIKNVKIGEGGVVSSYTNAIMLKKDVYNVPVWYI